MAVAKYTLAVDRRRNRNGDGTTDFISCVAFGKYGEFAERYLKKGMKICVSGRIQTGSYTNKNGYKVYTTNVIVEEHEFAESKESANTQAESDSLVSATQSSSGAVSTNGFMDIPDIGDDELPFN